MATATASACDLRGDLIEACSCMAPCPCWVDNASDEQYDALLDAFHGRLGGPLADLAGLITDRLAQYLERHPRFRDVPG